MHRTSAWALFAIVALGCSSGTPAAQPAAGGAAIGGTSGSTQTTGGSAGSLTGGGTGGMEICLVCGGGGAGGAGGAGAGAGGASAGAGAGGLAGSSTGGSGAALPSAGCGKAGRPQGGKVSVPNDRIYDFPVTYDGTKPMPAVIALHGANNPNTILEDLSNDSRLEEQFVRVFPKSNGNAWSFQNGTGADSMRISNIYAELLANYCVDTSRIFLMGHSSGAQMSVQMLCVQGGDKRFKAVAPVAASKYCDTLTPVPVMYIQGKMDAQRGGSDGANVVAVFSASNMCMASSVPYAPVMGCNSDFNQKPVVPGCIEYQGCVKPSIWCSHNDDSYNLTDGHMHGWPCFASDAIADFFLSLP